ncbi:MAG: hypothetical protein ACK2UV_16260 [Candidatus Promineifilaceae bacterium]|jgi:hypothetical protein
MEQLPLDPKDTPATYRICFLGALESSWAERLWGMTSAPIEEAGDPEQTMLVGEVPDQTVLVGIINALYNLGHTVVSVERMHPDANLSRNETNIEA